MTTIVARTRLNVTLYVRTLPVFGPYTSPYTKQPAAALITQVR